MYTSEHTQEQGYISDETVVIYILVVNLSPSERLKVFQTTCTLSPRLFARLVHALHPPGKVFREKEASRQEHCQSLLNWAESREDLGIREVEKQLSIMLSNRAGIEREFCTLVIKENNSSFTSSTRPNPQTCVQMLRERTGDLSLDISFYEKTGEDSITLVLSLLPIGLRKLNEFYLKSESKYLGLYYIEQLQVVEYTVAARKARLIEFLKLRGRFQPLASITDLDRARLYAEEISNMLRKIKAVPSIGTEFYDHYSLTAESDFIAAFHRTKDCAYGIKESISLRRGEPTLETYKLLLHGHDRSKYLADLINRTHTIVAAHSIFTSHEPINVTNLISSISFEHIKSCAFKLACNLDHTVRCNLADADLAGANLSGVNLSGVDLVNADMAEAIIEGVFF